MEDPKTMTEVAVKAASDLTNGMTALASASKQMAPHAWEIMVRQQIVEGIMGLITYLLGITVAIAFSKAARRLSLVKTGNGENIGYFGEDGPSPALPFVLIASAVTAVLIYKSFWGVPEYLGKIVNPEFYAARYLMDTVIK